MKRLKLLACKALYRELSLITATCDNFVDVTYIKQILHDTPKLLNKALAEEIKKIDEDEDNHTYSSMYNKRPFDAIIFGYGLCSNAVIGLSSEKYPLVIPKTDDCIGLFLGSYEKYKECFKENTGTYWYNASWIENSHMPSEENDAQMLEAYVEKYGEENAKYLMEDACLVANYNKCAYINWDELKFPKYEEYTKEAAKFYGWNYEKIQGDSCFLRDLIDGNWDDRFLIVPPGKTVVEDFNGGIMKAE